MSKCEVNIYWLDVDRIFIAEVPELPGCSAHGNSKAEALDQALSDGIRMGFIDFNHAA